MEFHIGERNEDICRKGRVHVRGSAPILSYLQSGARDASHKIRRYERLLNGLFGSIQVVRKVAVFPVSCKLAPWGMFRVQRSTKSDWKLETLLQQPHGLAGCCWEALLLRNGDFLWEASMCQNLAPTHRRLRHLDKTPTSSGCWAVFRNLGVGCFRASGSSGRSRFFLSVVNLGNLLGSSGDHQIRLKTWNLDRPKSPSVRLIRERTKTLQTFKAPTAARFGSLASCCWKALSLRNGGFSWEVSMCQNLAPAHWRIWHLNKGNRETVCKVQCEKFSGHWVSATCKTRVLPESLATGIQDLWISKSVQIGFKKDSTFKRFSETFKDSIRKNALLHKPFV